MLDAFARNHVRSEQTIVLPSDSLKGPVEDVFDGWYFCATSSEAMTIREMLAAERVSWYQSTFAFTRVRVHVRVHVRAHVRICMRLQGCLFFFSFPQRNPYSLDPSFSATTHHKQPVSVRVVGKKFSPVRVSTLPMLGTGALCEDVLQLQENWAQLI